MILIILQRMEILVITISEIKRNNINGYPDLLIIKSIKLIFSDMIDGNSFQIRLVVIYKKLGAT